MLDKAASETLADLRAEIDRIDARLHALLIERGEIIDRLIAAKSGTGGSAFRPQREAEMMRDLVSRHKGILPLNTVESIWRIIISTFTYVQANYSVHCDISGGDAQMRDCCRFYFGFTVPYEAHGNVRSVIDAVAAASGDLGLVAVEADPAAGAWWRDLAGPATPKIIARLPFVERQDHPAGCPLFVIAKPLSDAASRDVLLYDATAAALGEHLTSALHTVGAEICASAQDGDKVSLLIAAPGTETQDAITAALAKAGGDAKSLKPVGSHAARFDLGNVSGTQK
jgi:chorismate mutase